MCLVALGFHALWRYSGTASAAAENVPDTWPADSRIPLSRDRATLVLFAHPKCPCTHASLDELAWLLTALEGKAEARVLFVRPTGAPEGWERTDRWNRAVEIKGATVACDVDGVEAARFHARTSGQVVLYDTAGRLLFQGGITPARGHQGDNAGRRRVVSLVRTGSADAATNEVFGCGLVGEDPPPRVAR